MLRTLTEFVAKLNSRVAVENGTLRPKTEEERGGQESLFPQKIEVVEGNGVDIVIEGSCASSRLMRESDREYLVGNIYKVGLRRMIEKFDVKKAVVFASCCGEYNPGPQEVMKSEFPNVEFIFLRVHDFCDFPWEHAVELAEDFIAAGILKIG